MTDLTQDAKRFALDMIRIEIKDGKLLRDALDTLVCDSLREYAAATIAAAARAEGVDRDSDAEVIRILDLYWWVDAIDLLVRTEITKL